MKENDDYSLPYVAGTDNDAGSPGLPPLELDTDKYLPELDGLDITKAQKRELLEILASILRFFVELGFSTDICGQIFGAFNDAAEGAPGEVLSSHQSARETQANDRKDGDA